MGFLDQGLPVRRLRDNLVALDELSEDWFEDPLTAFKHGVIYPHPDGREFTVVEKQGVASSLIRGAALKGNRAAPDDVRMAEEVVKNLHEQGPLARLRKFSEYVEMLPGVQAGRPIIKGTRIETATIAGYEQTGMSKKEIAETLRVAEDQVGAALEFERALAAGLA